MGRKPLKITVPLAAVLACACAAGTAVCQPAAGGKSGTKGESSASAAAQRVAQWQLLLDELAAAGRALEQKEQRPSLVAEVADVYWDFDEPRAKELFWLALDEALSLAPEDASEGLTKILSLAARRDAQLSARLTERLIEHRAKSNLKAGEPLKVARDLVKSDSEAAARLVEAGAQFGPSMSSTWLTFQLAQQNPAAAERVYRAYFNNLAARGNPHLGSVLWLAGYAFGHGEGYGGAGDPVKFPGFNGLRVAGLTAKPDLATAYLSVASDAIQNALREAALREATEERDVLNGLAFYAVAYLSPEVERFRPDWRAAWAVLYQRAAAATSDARRAGVERRLQEILGARQRQAASDPAQRAGGQSGASRLEDVASLPEGCQRDKAYAEAALNASHAKDFNRAVAVIGNIKDAALRDGALQYVYYDAAGDAADKGEVDAAAVYAEKVAAREQRALLFLRMAGGALKKGDKTRAAGLLFDTQGLADETPDQNLKANLLLSVAGVFTEFDVLAAGNVLRTALAALNRAKEPNLDKFSVARRVNLSCGQDAEQWYGGSEQAEKFNLFETLSSVARADAQAALSITREISDTRTRVRAQLSVIRAAQRPKQQAHGKAGN